MGLNYVVITSVTRDDLPDGGAGQFARTITEVRGKLPGAKVEVLVPDFGGNTDALKRVLEAGPDVLNHNMETVRRLYPVVRPRADYLRSLSLLLHAKKIAPGIYTKSGFMLGLGENGDEVLELLDHLRENQCDFVTIGQYLRPTKKNLPVVEYILPGAFEELKERALAKGFRHVASGPLVRSSMHADEMFEAVKGNE
jgi:lipoic acid synthetase